MIFVGCKVYVLYAPASRCEAGAEHARCQIAIVTGGPYEPMEHPNQSVHRSWFIQPDYGDEVMAAEKILSPFKPASEKARAACHAEA